MPELPEVETIRRHVERLLVGLPIERIECTLPKLLRDSPLPDLSILAGKRIMAARRRAKVLVLDVEDDLALLVHFKLAGQFAIVQPDGQRAVAGHPVPKPDGEYPHKTTHLTIWFAGGIVAYYSDVRQFGWLRLMPATAVPHALDAFRFGPEGVGEPLDAAELAAKLRRRSVPVKTVLLDQTVIAGLGNIYVDEALHAARIYPARPANSLDDAEIEAVIAAIPWALTEGIKQGGAKIINSRAYPIDAFPAVHGRKGEPCIHCGGTVEKIRVGARGTYLCPSCQPMAVNEAVATVGSRTPA